MRDAVDVSIDISVNTAKVPNGNGVVSTYEDAVPQIGTRVWEMARLKLRFQPAVGLLQRLR